MSKQNHKSIKTKIFKVKIKFNNIHDLFFSIQILTFSLNIILKFNNFMTYILNKN